MTASRAGRRTWLAEAILVILLIVVLPLLNGMGFLSDYYLNLCGKYLSLAILALSMDLIWGYTGILSLGQAVFFGLGAYSMGMYLMLGSSGRGVYGAPIPDFMVWNRVIELPLFWKPFQYFPLAALSALLLPALVAAIIGWLTFRRRLSGTYFAILTQAMAYAAWLLFNRNELNLGGTNGLTDFKRLLGFSLSDPGTLRGLYLMTALGLVGSFLLCRWLVGSKTGLVLTAIRDQERRLHGAGKTTLLDVICGQVKPEKGRVIFGDKTDLSALEPYQIAALGIGRKFQTPSVFKHLTLFENLTLSLPQRWDLWSTLFGALTAADADKILAILETLGLLDKAHHKAGSLSHGEMQWLEIGMVMAQDPALLLLDEPVAGMTAKERDTTAQLLQRMAQDHAVLVVEHDMEFVRQTAQKVTVLHEGAVLCEGSVDRVQHDPRVVEVYLGRGYHADAHDSGAQRRLWRQPDSVGRSSARP